MTNLVNRLYLVACAVFTTALITASAQSARLVPESWNYINLQQLDWGLIPTAIAPTIQHEQVFTLRASGFPDLTISPVTFVASPEASPWSNCGLYLTPSGQKQTFINLFGNDDPGHCRGTQSIGLMTEPGPRPRLIIICRVISPRGPTDSEPIVLSWDAANRTYERNERQTDWLYNQGSAVGTVANVRRLLDRYEKSH